MTAKSKINLKVFLLYWISIFLFFMFGRFLGENNILSFFCFITGGFLFYLSFRIQIRN